VESLHCGFWEILVVDMHARCASRWAHHLSISAVLPAYNEEAVIAETVRYAAQTLRGLTDDFEVVVTDDGSHDRTGEILAKLADAEPSLNLQIVTHRRNEGYGAALASGFDAARNDLIFLADADGQFDIAELADLVSEMDDGTDLVIGWRRHRADPPMRLFNAWGWKILVNVLFGYTARDVDCAFKLFRRQVWEHITVRSRGATFSAELLIKARRLGFMVKEKPVTHRPRRTGSATGAKPSVIVRALKELAQLRLHLDQDLAADPRRHAVAHPSHSIIG
jgi:glycosyltransferase involved in cell wall biosynthesis